MALLHVSRGQERGLLHVVAVPILLLLIPIFDTTLVTVMRKLAGRPVSQGGRDHSSHRLVAVGLSERLAVILLYILAALAGLLAVVVSWAPAQISLAAVAGFAVLLTVLGILVARVKVYDRVPLRKEGK
jgi:UDP-GlcNAc:undecaprenyl-phosphate GlcNAc-1-phosphate transferase